MSESNFVLKEGVAEAAANWWVEVLKNPKFDNGANDSANALASMLATMTALDSNLDDNALSSFRIALIERIKEHFPNQWDLSFGVDYHPDLLLSECITVAGLDDSRFPWKTLMRVSHDAVVVSYGYAAPSVYVFKSES